MQLKPLETPPAFTGRTAEEIGSQVRTYLERLVSGIEENLRIIGDESVTEDEKAAIRKLIGR